MMSYPKLNSVTLLMAVLVLISLGHTQAKSNANTVGIPVVAPKTILLKATLNDPQFANQDSLFAELLETGEKKSIAFNKAFELNLPIDTLWNLCLQGKGQEKCYSLKYLGKDSVFKITLGGQALVTWFSDSTVETIDSIPEGQDSLEATPESNIDVDQLLSQQSATQLRKVVVQLRKKPKRKIGESVVSSKQIKRLPGLAEADVIRTLQALPGVTASSDFSTKIYVRGGGADQNLFLLDNAVVYSPVHFFGLFSTFLVEVVDEVKFYKSGFAPQYGNRLSSVVDIRSREGGTDTTQAWFDKSSVKISTFATQIHTEGHKGDTRWIFAGRSTYIKQILDLMNAAGVIDFELDYKFTDIQGHVSHKFNDDHRLAISFYTGEDVLDFDPISIDWGNTIIPINYSWRINEDWKYQATASYSFFDQAFGLRDLFGVFNEIKTWSLKQSATNTGMYEGHEIAFGYDLEYTKVNFTQDLIAFKQKFVDTTTLYHHSLYLQDAWKLGDLDLQFGMRTSYQTLAEYFSFEPRLSVQYRFGKDEDQLVNGHLGYYRQFLNSILFSDQETLNEFYYPSRKNTTRTVEPTGSVLATLGYTKERLFEEWNFNTEVYYKTQNHLVVFDVNSESDQVANSLSDLFKEGSGYSFGYELSLRRLAGAINGGINFSQGWSVILEQGDDVPYFPDWHQPYSLKGDLGVTWKGEEGLKPATEKGRYLRSSLQLKYASGLPFTEYLGYHNTWDLNQSTDQGAGGPTPEFENNLAARLGNRNTTLQPDYFRLDLKAIDWGVEGKWNFSWTILNITNHENVFIYTVDTNTNPPTETTITQFPFFPVLLNYERYF